MSDIHHGSTFDDFLRDEGIYEEATSTALARVLAWQIQQHMQEEGLTKQAMARRMGTSRSQPERRGRHPRHHLSRHKSGRS
jgi:antitoxin HicB